MYKRWRSEHQGAQTDITVLLVNTGPCQPTSQIDSSFDAWKEGWVEESRIAIPHPFHSLRQN